jgi:hypothetical protein
MSVEDLLRYAEFHLGDGIAASGERLLTQASLEAMRTPRIQKNSSTDEMGRGWHLRSLGGVLTAQHGGTLDGNERMTNHAQPLATQPALDEYVGSYHRPPVGDVGVREEGGRLMIGLGANTYGLVFWGPDVTYATGPGAFLGMAVEFIRDDSGAVTWVRVNGRIARKEER